MDWLFKLRGELTPQRSLVLTIIGVVLFILVWSLLTMGGNPMVSPAILPSPLRVLRAFPDLINKDNLIVNLCKSIGLNLSGYILAILISLPLGFMIGLYPVFRGLFSKFLDAIRFVPLTATIGLFIVWLGIGTTMKSWFMAFGILIFFLPVVVQRIDEVKDVYLKTVYTLGATDWQTIRSVYFPSVISSLWNDLRIMTAISWTYIVFVEGINAQGGLGSIIYTARRMSRIDKMFALLILIILVGIVQDRIFSGLDKQLFPFKYQTKNAYQAKPTQFQEMAGVIGKYIKIVLAWVAMFLYILFVLDELFGILGGLNILTTLFGGTVWVIHFIFLIAIGVTGYKYFQKFTKS